MSKAARMAGMDRMYLHRLVQKHGLRGGQGQHRDQAFTVWLGGAAIETTSARSSLPSSPVTTSATR